MVQDQKISKSMSGWQWVMLATLSILWGGSFFFNGVALKEIPTFTLVVGRVAIAAVVLGLFMKVSGQAMPVSPQVWGAFLVMGVLNNVVPFSLIVWGQLHMASGVASILNATTPLFTVLVAHWLTADEKMNSGRIVGVVAGFAGVGVMIGGDALGAVGMTVLAPVAILAAALSYAFASVWGRRFRAMGVAPLATATGQVTASSIVLLPVMFVVDQPWALPMPGMNAIAALIGVAVLSTALAYILYFRILASAGATNLALVTFLVPVSAILLGVMFLDEVLLPKHFIGMAMIGFGLAAIDGRPWDYLRNWSAAGASGILVAVLGAATIVNAIQSAGASAATPAATMATPQESAKTVVSIKPIHSLVAGVLEGVEKPGLLISAGTPHNFALKPSQARRLYGTDTLFMVSPVLERSLEKVRLSLGTSTRVVYLSETPGLVRYRVREGGTFDHHDHAHAHADEGHAQDGHDGEAKHIPGGARGDGVDVKQQTHEIDAHIWLDPVNAGLIVRHVAKVMSKLRPSAADRINANAARLVQRLERLTSQLNAKLRPLAGKPYVVFHDAYQYFERRFGLEPIGSVTLGADQLPGARRIMALRKKLAGFGRACVFSEPQFQPRLVAAIVDGTKSSTAVLDPIGATLQPGPELYFKLMRNLADGFSDCLGAVGN